MKPIEPPMPRHEVVSPTQWTAARMELLKKKKHHGFLAVLGFALALSLGGPNDIAGQNGGTKKPVPLKEAKLIIEHNATDEDTGFQGFIDSEGWERLDITGPDGKILTFTAHPGLRSLGLTELFFETVEPENAEVPIDDVLAVLPEGLYTIEGKAVEGGRTIGTALLTHNIPAGPILLFPPEGATVLPINLVVSWSPVTTTITGENVTIIRYQVIVEVDEEPHPHAIGKRGMSIYVPASVTSMTVPNEFLEPGTDYLWEVLAIEESGNQTLSSGTFTTE